MIKVNTKKNVEEAFTKPLGTQLFVTHRYNMGVRDASRLIAKITVEQVRNVNVSRWRMKFLTPLDISFTATPVDLPTRARTLGTGGWP